jgi:hypothetical protein
VIEPTPDTTALPGSTPTLTEQPSADKPATEPSATKTTLSVSKSPPAKTASPIFSTPVQTSGSYKRFKSFHHQASPQTSSYQPHRHTTPSFYSQQNQQNKPPYQQQQAQYAQASYLQQQQYLHYAQPAYPYQSSQPVLYQNNANSSAYQIQANQFQSYQQQLAAQQQAALVYNSVYQQQQSQQQNFYQNQQTQQQQLIQTVSLFYFFVGV